MLPDITYRLFLKYKIRLAALSYRSQYICQIGYYFLLYRAFPSFLLMQRHIRYALASLQYACKFTCQYNLDSINAIACVLSCIRSTLFTATLQPSTISRRLINGQQMMMSRVSRNFVSYFPYLVGNTKTFFDLLSTVPDTVLINNSLG